MTESNLREDQRGKFYFIRGFWTTLGILLGWTVWVILPAIILLILFSVLGGIGSLIPEGAPIGEPTGNPLEPPPTFEPSATCGEFEDEPC
jgi:hypothetical protein